MKLKTVRSLVVLFLTFVIPFMVPVLLRVFFKTFQFISTCQMLTCLLFIILYTRNRRIPTQSYFYLKNFLVEKIAIMLSFVVLKVPTLQVLNIRSFSTLSSSNKTFASATLHSKTWTQMSVLWPIT
jgi:hypothetical protein